MYDSIMLTLIFLVLVWIAVGLQVIASSVRLLGKMFRPTPRKLRELERNNMPWLIKMVAVRVISRVVIRYIGKKIK